MTANRCPQLRCAAVVLAQLCCLACAQAGELRHDVFARPALAPVAPAPPERVRSDEGPTGHKPAWNPTVRALIAAGRDSLANVEGTILRIGWEIDGYRLVEVREREVVFVKGRQRYTLALAPLKVPDAAPQPPGTSAYKAPETAAESQTSGSGRAPDAAPESQTRGDRQVLDTTRISP